MGKTTIQATMTKIQADDQQIVVTASEFSSNQKKVSKHLLKQMIVIEIAKAEIFLFQIFLKAKEFIFRLGLLDAQKKEC